MVLKVVIWLGVLLMLAGFGAAGLQYWQGLPRAVVAEGGAEGDPGIVGPPQTWLISPTGGPVPRDDVRAYLVQDRFVQSRVVEITRTVALEDLLADGERLPERPYLQVLADIRAPMAAEGACSALLERLAADCAVQTARAVEASVDPIAGTARVRTALVYTLKPEEEALPDLSARTFETKVITLSFDAQTEGAATVDDLLRSAIAAANTGCDGAEGCRVLRMGITWEGNGAGTARVEVGVLAPLPKGMFPAPPLG
jgi:hypothetical protein